MKQVFKHDDATRYINLYLVSQDMGEEPVERLKIIIEKLLQYLEVMGFAKIKRKDGS